MEDYKKSHALDTFGYGYYMTNTNELEYKSELEQMVLVAEATKGGGYDWDDFYAYYHTGRKRYYYVYGSGCSCNSISDGMDSLADFMDVSTQDELIRAFKREMIEKGYAWDERDLVTFTSEVKSFKEYECTT